MASSTTKQNEVMNFGGGKDTVIIASKEDHEEPSSITLVDRPEDREPGPILPNGEINWSCPCLGSMASGPCAVEFRDAFSCFHYSKAEPKGSSICVLFVYVLYISCLACLFSFGSVRTLPVVSLLLIGFS